MAALVRVHPQRVKLVNVSNEGADGMENGARRGGQDGQLFSVKEAREVRFVQALVRSAGDGLVEPGE